MSEPVSNDADVRARIFREADRLYDEGGRERFPPVADVREAARADMNTASRVMKEWRRQQTAKPELVQIELPPVLHQAAMALGANLWTEAMELANANLRKAETDWQLEREDMESTRIELSQLFEEQQGELTRLRHENADLLQRRAECDLALVELRTQLAHETARADSAEARHDESGRRVDDLKGELQRAHETETALRGELAAAQQAHQLELEQARVAAGEAVERVKAEQSEAKGRAEARIDDLSARAAELQQRLDAALREQFRLQALQDTAQDQRQQAATAAQEQAQRFINVQGERDEARSQAQATELRAARLDGELTGLRDSNAQLLAQIGQAAKSKKPQTKTDD